MVKDILLMDCKLTDINPLVCGEESCEPKHAFGPAVRTYYLLHYVISGKGYFQIENKRYEVLKGQVFVILPFQMTYYEADEKMPWHYCWIGFESNRDLGELLQGNIIHIPEGEHIFHSIRNCEHMEHGKEFYICGKIYEFLAQLTEQKTEIKCLGKEYALKAKHYIEVNYMKPITIEIIASMLNLDRSYFSTLFKKYIGKTPKQYLVDFRLEKAAELMVNYGYKPGEAALSTGYVDIFNFSKMFKKKFGISPKEYAKKQL